MHNAVRFATAKGTMQTVLLTAFYKVVVTFKRLMSITIPPPLCKVLAKREVGIMLCSVRHEKHFELKINPHKNSEYQKSECKRRFTHCLIFVY